MKAPSNYLQNCLFFTANALARSITRMAEKAFRDTGLSPSLAFAVMLVNDQPGITVTELAEHLHLAPSTLTRFADKLVYQDLVERRQHGKRTHVYPTDRGRAMQSEIEKAWSRLHEDYCAVLGREAGDALARETFAAHQRLEDLT
ncbi:MarR family transcriptional regulator [uncultured Pseudodesulfovibrio sp.]|uniref:MarR family winged helix-turn-helix transcriptional regulator n=1 Tax=uncultured Pseudodesulfovibrio sp. TaxID=2035858 RepID=UPI0029C76898|nr:MarR family transcriptional regulator [uncultured Pseudodesulfovibrio sp.]